jgi:hypothetical protein
MDVAGERCAEPVGDSGCLSLKKTRASLMNVNTCASGFKNPADVAVAAFHGAFSLTCSLGVGDPSACDQPCRQPLTTIASCRAVR